MNKTIFNSIISKFSPDSIVHIFTRAGADISMNIDELSLDDYYIVVSSLENGMYFIPYDSIDYIRLKYCCIIQRI